MYNEQREKKKILSLSLGQTLINWEAMTFTMSWHLLLLALTLFHIGVSVIFSRGSFLASAYMLKRVLDQQL